MSSLTLANCCDWGGNRLPIQNIRKVRCADRLRSLFSMRPVGRINRYSTSLASFVAVTSSFIFLPSLARYFFPVSLFASLGPDG